MQWRYGDDSSAARARQEGGFRARLGVPDDARRGCAEVLAHAVAACCAISLLDENTHTTAPCMAPRSPQRCSCALTEMHTVYIYNTTVHSIQRSHYSILLIAQFVMH